MKTISNWARNIDFVPASIHYPDSEEAIVSLVKMASKNKQILRVMGSGHSWTRLIETEQILVSLDRFQGIDEVNHDNQTVRVRAGTQLSVLGELLYAEGLAMENLGDIDSQSIAGALSTGTHGTGIAFKTLSNQISALTMVMASGQTLECSEHQNKDIFKAAQLSLGALGIITHFTLNLVPGFKLKLETKKVDLDILLTHLDEYKNNNRHFEFYWFPYAKTAQVKCVNPTDEALRDGGLAKKFNDLILENAVFGAVSYVSRAFPSLAKQISKLCAKLMSSGAFINHSHKIFATQRLVRFNEMEYNIPAEHFVAVMKEIKSCIEHHQFAVHFPIECRWVKGDDIFISPANGRDSAYIAVHMFKGMPYKDYFNAIEAIFTKYGGRPHYGKMHSLKSEDFTKLYPNWQRFAEIRHDLDPDGIFLNPYLKDMLTTRCPTES
ncbi:D-arabinono-1,4-lactone oxidase [Veronia pacifica]|uniref:FAD-binding oxidoreductase n=1 Tax=Veronia pacifica TaxID=1080227 RepID=A0A1C3E9K8_9GAMM|nr:D-arabinono-1,4-lactone oxidase [Veronia pacifica]ODA29913.1 FAD-binding oxidoreductase [Veronia pacifica]